MKNNRNTPLIVVALFALAMLCSACAHRVSHLTAETVTTSPVVTVQGSGTNAVKSTNLVTVTERRTLRESGTVAMDAKNSMDKFKASNSPKTQSVGFTGAEQESSGSNMVEALRSIDSILSKVRPTP